MRIALALVMVVGCSKGSDPVTAELAESKIAIARLQVQRLAQEAFPQWAVAHSRADCPGSLRDLVEYTNSRDDIDPWGAPLRMGCGPTLPAGAKDIAVWSLGPDGADGTADDVRSWK